MTEYVYLTRSSRSNETFHPDRDCSYLPEDPTRRSRGPLEDIGYTPCPYCTGEKSRGGNVESDRSHYDALEAAGASDD